MTQYTRITKRKPPKKRSTTEPKPIIIRPWVVGKRIDYTEEFTDGLISFINQDKGSNQIQIEYKPNYENLVSKKTAQARFEGRLVLEPQFEVNEYNCKAVIDYVEFLIVTDQDISENRFARHKKRSRAYYKTTK